MAVPFTYRGRPDLCREVEFAPGLVPVVHECAAQCSGCDASHRVLYRDPGGDPNRQLCRSCLEAGER